MHKWTAKPAHRRLTVIIRLVALVAVTLFCPATPQATDLATYALSDVRVLYLFETPESVDWPTLYYLNDQFGCRLDLVTFGLGREFRETLREVPHREIYLHTFFVDPDDSLAVDSVMSALYESRPPDIVVIGEIGDRQPYPAMERKLRYHSTVDSALFQVANIFRVVGPDTAAIQTGRIVTLSSREMYRRYRQRLELEVPILFSWMRPEDVNGHQLVQYAVVTRSGMATQPGPDFLSGLSTNRLVSIIDSTFSGGALEGAFLKRARNYLSFFGVARLQSGRERLDNLMAGYRELITLVEQSRSEPLLRDLPGFMEYLEGMRRRAQRAVMDGIGMDWNGRIILRDSPHGPRLKFRASLSVNGPEPIELSYIRFHPYWDTSVVVLDSTSRSIQPHQSFVQEYLVDIERSRLEAKMAESLLFTADIVYGRFPMQVASSIPIWEQPDLGITFQPAFHFIQPFARLDVDRVVASMNWKAVITKPKHYYGTVDINLETPRGVFAGAYKQQIELDRGSTRETVRIPFSVSNLFELGVHSQTITLSIDGRAVAADTGIMRIASCQVDDTVQVGFLPDTTGLLEDILRMTDAAFRPLTDRTLLTGDLDAYDVIVIGSGALRDYPSFRKVKDRVEEYLRYGGSLVVFGQPSDWEQGLLPVSLIPSEERVVRAELYNRIPQARVLSRPHAITEAGLLADFSSRRPVQAAIVSPAERVYVTPTGATLLSVSRIGDGQIIYCGLPLVEMVSRLNIEAIHLLANILNY